MTPTDLELREQRANELHELRQTVSRLRAELAHAEAEHITLMRVSGALVDARTVPVEPYDAAIRALATERDAARAVVEAARECVRVMGKCSPGRWASALREAPARDDQREGERLDEMGPAFTSTWRETKKALAAYDAAIAGEGG